MIRVVQVVADGRESFKRYEDTEPQFHASIRALLQGLADRPDLDVHVVSCAKRPMTSPEVIAGRIHFHGVTVPQYGWLRTAYWGCTRALGRRIHDLEPDVVHGQGTENYAALAAARSGCPNVVTVRGNMTQVARAGGRHLFVYHRLAAFLERQALTHAGGAVCLTSYAERLARPLARRTWRVPNAVEKEFFDVAWTGSDSDYVLCLADVVNYKNQIGLVDALLAVRKRWPIQAVFIGAGDDHSPYAREFRQRIHSLSWCRHEGRADRERVREFLSRARLMVLPSFEDNCPMAVLEAMAAGTPVAASAIGGIPDLVRDGDNGRLFDPADPPQMAAILGAVIADPESAARMACLAKADAKRLYHPDVIAAQHVALYEDILRARM